MKSPGLEVVVEVLRVAGTAPCGSRRSSLEGDSVTRQSEEGLGDHAQRCEIQRHQLGHLHRHSWMGWAGAMVLRPVWRQGEGVTLVSHGGLVASMHSREAVQWKCWGSACVCLSVGRVSLV